MNPVSPIAGQVSSNLQAVTAFQARTKVVFGEGAVDRLGEHLAITGRVLIVTGRRSAALHGHLERVLTGLGGKISAVVSANISPNPRLAEVEAAAALGIQERVTAVLGLGGGSAMDAAKGVAAALGNAGRITEVFRQGAAVPDTALPVACVPTTAGTGSETSKGAILTDEETGVKGGLRGDAILPRWAIVDPELTYSLPTRLTAETGFDVLTHAMETWVSRKAGPIVEIFSRHAIASVHRWLPYLVKGGNDPEGRRELSLASLLMGYNLANSSTCLPHRLQYPVGAATDTSHPAGLAALYPAWCENTFAAAPHVFEYVGRVLGGEGTDAARVPDLMRGFLRDLGLACGLRDLGVGEGDLEGLAGRVSGSLDTDPGDTSAEALVSLYRRSW